MMKDGHESFVVRLPLGWKDPSGSLDEFFPDNRAEPMEHKLSSERLIKIILV